jgi:hypothetical protein
MPIILITTLCASYIFFCIVMALSADFGLITKNGEYFHVFIVCWGLMIIVYTHFENKWTNP